MIEAVFVLKSHKRIDYPFLAADDEVNSKDRNKAFTSPQTPVLYNLCCKVVSQGNNRRMNMAILLNCYSPLIASFRPIHSHCPVGSDVTRNCYTRHFQNGDFKQDVDRKFTIFSQMKYMESLFCQLLVIR